MSGIFLCEEALVLTSLSLLPLSLRLWNWIHSFPLTLFNTVRLCHFSGQFSKGTGVSVGISTSVSNQARAECFL